MFEHPATATSWEDQSLKELLKLDGVLLTILDMCRYGMIATDKDGTAPVRKSTKIATNAPEVADALSHRCEGGHRHVHLVSGRPKDAAIYPSGFCKAAVKGLSMYYRRRESGIKWNGNVGVFEQKVNAARGLMNFSREDLCDPVEEELHGRYIDDIKGCELDPTLARAARKEEIE